MTTTNELYTDEAKALHERFPDGTKIYVDTIDPYHEPSGRPRRFRGKAIVIQTIEDIRDDHGDGESGPMPPSIYICLEVRPVTDDPEEDAPWYVHPDDQLDTVEKIDV